MLKFKQKERIQIKKIKKRLESNTNIVENCLKKEMGLGRTRVEKWRQLGNKDYFFIWDTNAEIGGDKK